VSAGEELTLRFTPGSEAVLLAADPAREPPGGAVARGTATAWVSPDAAP
jgi:hypothetical protein